MVTNLVANILLGYGNDAQKKEFLRPIAQGKSLGAFCLSEPEVAAVSAYLASLPVTTARPVRQPGMRLPLACGSQPQQGGQT